MECQMLKYENIEVAVTDLPAESLKILAQRGFTHVFGNECAAYKTRLVAKGKMTEDEISAAVVKWTETKFAALVDGTFTVRASGPRLSGIESLMKAIAKKWLINNTGLGGAIIKVKALAAARGEILSKDEAFAHVLHVFSIKKADEIRAEAERQISASKDLGDDDDDLINDVMPDRHDDSVPE